MSQNNFDNNNELIPIIISNSYIKKYYLDNRLETLPKEIKDTLKRIFVTFTENVGGMAVVTFDNKDYKLVFEIKKNDDDIGFDEINANYKLTRLEQENIELFDQIAKFCKFKLNGLV